MLSAVSFVYETVVNFRNYLYDHQYLKSVSFSIPTILIGNLSVGGTGKTPHIEYLITLLQNNYSLATLSRGYKRTSKGFVLANANSKVGDIGDEPLQLYTKFKNIVVSVCESRVKGIYSLLNKQSKPIEVILLDDAYQHRALKAGFQILLTPFDDLYCNDFCLPKGKLREPPKNANRADVIIISKCAPNISQQQQQQTIEQINPQAHQHIFFSTLSYGSPYSISNYSNYISLNKNMSAIWISGIAQPHSAIQYLTTQVGNLQTLLFSDHHYFTKKNLNRLHQLFLSLSESEKIIITSEKDATRLQAFMPFIQQNKLPIFCLPTQVKFINTQQQSDFNLLINNYISKQLFLFK